MTNKRHNAILISSIFLLALLLRVYHHHHTLTSDEAQNMLTIKALIEGDELRDYFFKHPPLFIIFAAALSYPFGGNHHLVQGISIIFSILSFIPFYLIIERLFDRRMAIVSLFSLAIMPLNISYSTWIKQDATLLFFFLLSMYYYLTERPWKSGFFFGIASLTKEFAWFLLPIVVGWELLKGRPKGESLKSLGIWMLAGLVLSTWWYIFFGEHSFEAIGAAAVGGNLFEYQWHLPWYFYLRNLLVDLDIVLFPLFIVGIICMQKGQKRLPVLWVLAFYVPLSIMRVKAHWYPYLASPAMATVAAVGLLRIWDIIDTKWCRYVVIVVLSIAIFLSVERFNLGRVFSIWAPIKARTIPFPEKEYLDSGRKVFKGEGKVALLQYNPILQYYLGISDNRLTYFGPQFPAMNKDMLRDMVAGNNAGWLVIDTDSVYFVDKRASLLTELWGKPKKIGRVLIFMTASEGSTL